MNRIKNPMVSKHPVRYAIVRERRLWVGVLVGVDMGGMAFAWQHHLSSAVGCHRVGRRTCSTYGGGRPSIVMPHTKPLYVYVRHVIRRADYVQRRRTAPQQRCHCYTN